MKKGFRILVAIIIVLCIGLVNVPPSVEAKDTKVAEGAWNTGTEVDVDAQVPDNLNLLTKGVKVTKPGLICHPFNGGRFGWVGEIRQLVKGNWVKLVTTNDWYPDKEGQFMSCAQAPAAGTYALFGYWIRPAGYVEEFTSDIPFDCSSVEWEAYLFNPKEIPVDLNKAYFFPFFRYAPIGTPVTYSVTNMVPDNVFGGALTGYVTLSDDYSAVFLSDYLTFDSWDSWSSVTVDFSFLGCTFTKTIINNPT